MPLKQSKPTSPGRRHRSTVFTPGLHKGKPYKALTRAPAGKCGGRNNTGRITVRHRGGGTRGLYRVIDFKRKRDGVKARVERIEYDPNRTAHIALLCYVDGQRAYILAPKGLRMGDEIESGATAPFKVGNAMPMRNMPLGSQVHCVELKIGGGAQLIRSAGASAQLVSREGDYVLLRLKSGETRRLPSECRATLGEVGNGEHSLRSIGKAGAKRWQGIRPTVRGVAMNPVDHPHGGGEGRTSGGRHPVTPWGKPTKGYKTRGKRPSDSMILRRRGNK